MERRKFEVNQQRRRLMGGSLAFACTALMAKSGVVLANMDVTENNLSRVEPAVFERYGITAPSFTVEVPGGELLTLPRKLKVVRQYHGQLYVAYENLSTIFVYDGKTSQYIKSIELYGQDGVLRDFAMSDNGELFVLFWGKHRVFHYSAQGSLLQKIGTFGIEYPQQLNGPRSLTVDKMGNVHVWNSGTRTIKVFSSGSVFLEEYSAHGIKSDTVIRCLDGSAPVMVITG